MVHLPPVTRLHLQRGAEHLHRLGARPTAEFLAEIGNRIGGLPCILSLLGEYEQRLKPETLRRAAADRFPPRAPHAVPRS